LHDAALAGARAIDITARKIFANWPVKDRTGADTTRKEIISALKNIIQEQLGPMEHPQYIYRFYIDETKLDAANITRKRRGEDPILQSQLEAEFVRGPDNKLTADTQVVTTQDRLADIVADLIDWTVPELVTKMTKTPYKKETAMGELYPNYLKMTKAGVIPDFAYEKIQLTYDYTLTPATPANEKFKKFTDDQYEAPPNFVNTTTTQSLSNMSLFDYLTLRFGSSIIATSELANRKYSFTFPDFNNILVMKVVEFFETVLELEESLQKNPFLIQPGNEETLRFKDEFFPEDYAKYTQLRQELVLEVIKNEVITNGPAESFNDLKNKADFYEYCLRQQLNTNSDTTREIENKALLDQINEKRREIALVNSGTYNKEAEAKRTDLLSNTQSGPAMPGGGSPVPMSSSLPGTTSATTVPQDSQNNPAAPEQTNAESPPR
jgi:hypothetical protein